MNKKLEKIVSKVAKPIAKVMLPLALTFGAYQAADAQQSPRLRGPTIVVVEEELSETLNVREQVGYGPYARYDKATRHLDVLKVYMPSSGNHLSLIYMGDLSWNKGDTLKLEIAIHKERDSNTKSWWTDYELTKYYLGEDLVNATTPSRKRYHTGVITDIKEIISGKKD